MGQILNACNLGKINSCKLKLGNFVCPIASCNCTKFEGNQRWWVSEFAYMYHFYMELPLRKSSDKIFRNSSLKMIPSSPNPVYDIHNPLGLPLLTGLRLGPSHLNEHKFNHNFKICVKPLCTWSLEIVYITFSPHCNHYNNICSSLLNELKSLGT